jgi:hypothetical protein
MAAGGKVARRQQERPVRAAAQLFRRRAPKDPCGACLCRLDRFLENWIHAKEGVVYTPNQRLALFPEQGTPGPSLQHTANAAMLALVYSQYHAEYSLTYR